MSNERKHHQKGDRKDRHREDSPESDDAKHLSQHVQHIMKHKHPEVDNLSLSHRNRTHLPDLKITGKEGTKSSSDPAKEVAKPGQCTVPDATKKSDVSDSTKTTDKVEAPKTEDSLSKKFGVKVILKNGKYECSLSSSGKDEPLGTYENLDSLDADLTKKVDDKKHTIAKEFKVVFETAKTSPEYAARAREPRLDELDALDSALQKSRASVNYSKDLRVLFLDEWKPGDPAMQTQGNAVHRVVVFGTGDRAVTTAQRSAAEKEAGILHSVEDDFLHEFGHVAENTADPADYSKLGWKHLENGSWAKMTNDDKLYIWNERKNANCENPEGWVEVDAMGAFVHPDSLDGLITNAQMKEKALVKPSSDYFYTSRDDFAEGIARYRQSPESRAKLAREAPELSKYVEEFDNREIADKLGVGLGNKPLYKRNEQFVIVRDESVAEKSVLTKVQEFVAPYFIYVPPIFYPH